jgi:hypothetical protein
MELTTFFMTALGLVCLCHIAFSIDQFILGKGVRREVTTPARCDEWYCFFKLDDLLGKRPSQGVERPRAQKRPRPRPRMQA